MYQVVVPLSVVKQIKRLPVKSRERVLNELDRLAVEPRPPDCVKLTGQDLFRVRVGDYRVIYAVDDDARHVIVARVGHRRDVYR